MKIDIDSPDYNDTNQGDCRDTQEERDIIRLEKRLIEVLQWKSLSVTAVAADNPNVAAYLKQVENQLATARENEASARNDLCGCQRENERLTVENGRLTRLVADLHILTKP